MARLFGRTGALIAVVTILVLGVAGPASAGRPQSGDQLRADLDGKPISPLDVGKWYCHDFAYPLIHCFSDPKRLEDSTQVTLAASGITYLTVYEFTTYQGAFMHMSANYSLLSLIGWNDRISSFQVKNGQSGSLWTDWLYSGTRYNFCCNQLVGSLGSFNDTFSSVFRN